MKKPRIPDLWFTALALVAGICPAPAFAADFAVAVSPPRFELQLKPGAGRREVLELTSASTVAATFTVRTADWTFGADASVNFVDELLPGSCRPWVAIERRQLTVQPGRPVRFRFEVAAPADAPAQECRFALLIEGQEQTTGGNALKLPFNARIGVIVYAAVGDVKPQLAVAGARVDQVNGAPTPVLLVRNDGNAHGRLAGFLSGTDAAGTKLEFSPASAPILPGETRAIALMPNKEGDTETVVAVKYPVTVTGKLEWGQPQSPQSLPLEQRFAP
ncbi:MAG: hypothetical protein ABI589_03585 [Burkholderiales bacterium]